MSHVFESFTDNNQHEPSSVTDFRPSKRKLVVDAVSDYCDLVNIVGQQKEIIVEAALQELAKPGATVNDAIIQGQRCANRLAKVMRELRTRYGTRPDGGEAA